MTESELNTALLKAHADANDGLDVFDQLVELYYKAYQMTVNKNANAGYFYLTNAYVYALDSDHNLANHIEKTLNKAGRL